LTLHPVILCGGPGSRLWPASTPGQPKPFLDLIGGHSLFQRTVRRMAALQGAGAPIVVAGLAHLPLVRAQVEALGLAARLLAEPEGRDSAPAIIAAALLIAREDPEGLAMVVASDHHIPDVGAFANAVMAAAPLARAGHIVTFGIAPASPSRAYGYVRPGEALSQGSPVRRVAAFHEKPSEALAATLIAEGCLWNSGNFLFRADVMLAEAGAHCPGLVGAVEEALDQGWSHEGAQVLGPAFRRAEKVSIDIGVMECTALAAVMPVDYAWSDLGAWDAIWAAADRDESGNAVSGAVALQSSHGSLVRAGPGIEVVGIGLKTLAVVATEGKVLVCDLAHAPQIKSAVEALGAGTAQAESLAQVEARLMAWFHQSALPTWWCFGADHARGGFHDRLRWDYSAVADPRRLRVQARQVFAFARAGAGGWQGPWRAAVAHGLAYLEARFARPDGLYRTRVSADGKLKDDSAVLYDQAFVLLALAAAAKASPGEAAALSARARRLAERIGEAYGAPSGGFSAREGGTGFEADPIMHLFEAVQAWHEVEETGPWRELAGAIADHALTRMIARPRPLMREVFDAKWRGVTAGEAGLIMPGHQFEWAWLLETWGVRVGDARARAAARDLYAAGGHGVDPASGVTLNVMRDDFTPAGGAARLWPQAERLRAALSLETDPAARTAAALSAAGALEAYFTPAAPGLWRDTRPDAPLREEAALASTLYHLVGALEALRDHVRREVSPGSGVLAA
jgi:mannose-1-phosphate guanylyltransferase/mannose-6-phosphate isomerase